MDRPELIIVPHHELEYSEEARRDVSSYSVEEIKNFDKQAAVHYSRAVGLQETGMSPNEVGLMFDLLEKKGKCRIVELGRNFGCSTRMLLQHVVRHGGFLESWDLKHWGNVRETWVNQGFKVEDVGEDYVLWKTEDDFVNGAQGIAHIRVANSMKTHIKPDARWVDFLLIDTEHGLENALGEYMRWREYLNSGSIIAFHDSSLPAVARAIEICIEVESTFGGRILKQYRNERIDGFGIEMLEWKG